MIYRPHTTVIAPCGATHSITDAGRHLAGCTDDACITARSVELPCGATCSIDNGEVRRHGETCDDPACAPLSAGSVVYWLHFSEAVGNTDEVYGHVRHYCGSAVDLARRLREHILYGPEGVAAGAKGNSGLVYAAAHRYGASIRVAWLWAGGTNEEQAVKRQKAGARLCPACSGEAAYRRATKIF